MTRLYAYISGLIDRISSNGDIGKKVTIAIAVAIWLGVTIWQVMKIL